MEPKTRIHVVALLTTLFAVAAVGSQAANSLARDEDPVVIRGTQLQSFAGVNPDSIVAFCYHDGWIQVPVQVAERDVVDFGVPYDTTNLGITATMYVYDIYGRLVRTSTGTDGKVMWDGTDARGNEAPARKMLLVR